MRITYPNTISDPDVSVTTANCQIPLFGCWCKFSITSYALAKCTAITFGLNSLNSKEKNVDSKHTFDAMPNGLLNVDRKYQGIKQGFQQKFEAPSIVGQLLAWSELGGGGVDAGRTVSKAILDKVASIAETVRQNVRKNIGNEVRDIVLKGLARYDEITRRTIKNLLREIIWPLMFQKAEIDEETLAVIEASLDGRNLVKVNSISDDNDTDIPLVYQIDALEFDRTTLANIKATTLLYKVCGEESGRMFDNHGYIIVKKHGYQFQIKPNQFVECYDPDGHKGMLCIHTQSFAVNPIDELLIAYLHIKNKFDEYMDLAVLHAHDRGFQKNRKINA